ncbi:MAG: protein translocase subunit SecD [Gemmataceae bacterium]
MKSFTWRIFICVVPVLAAVGVCLDSLYTNWMFQVPKLGVDLAGGTILVYEMDIRKSTDGKSKAEEDEANYTRLKANELAEALRQRIDPTATYNIIIRPASTAGRVEIIIPTGGRQKVQKASEAWKNLLDELKEEYAIPDLNERRGAVGKLVEQIQKSKAQETWSNTLFNPAKNDKGWSRLLETVSEGRQILKVNYAIPTPIAIASQVGMGVRPVSSTTGPLGLIGIGQSSFNKYSPIPDPDSDEQLQVKFLGGSESNAGGQPVWRIVKKSDKTKTSEPKKPTNDEKVEKTEKNEEKKDTKAEDSNKTLTELGYKPLWAMNGNQSLKLVKEGDLDALSAKLQQLLVDETPQSIKVLLKKAAWDELIAKLTEWDYVRDAFKKENPKNLETRLERFQEILKRIPIDSFDELVGRVATKGNVIGQALIVATEPLFGDSAGLGEEDLLDREKIIAEISKWYGPPSIEVERHVEDLIKELDIVEDSSIAEVARIEELVSRVGKLEFRILANQKDDKDAIDAARDYLNSEDPERIEELKRANDLGLPPPVPTNENNEPRRYEITLSRNEGSLVDYAWVEIGRQARHELGLNNNALNSKDWWKREIWTQVHENKANPAMQIRRPGKEEDNVFQWGGALFYWREVPKTASEERRKKKYEYFVLSRNPEFFLNSEGQPILDDEGTPKQRPRITGKFLRLAKASMDTGSPTVDFAFNNAGATEFGNLTGKNVPTGAGKSSQTKRHLAIILDEMLMSAPTINSKITSRGQITGDFTRREVDSLVNILRSGALPATLKKEPVSRSTTGSLLGEDTIRAGVTAVFWAFVGVLAFMLVYYQFSGLVACIALFANLILTIGFMIAVKATFTLPGLAGLVLMLGMAVDANVLIYERLREERERGASLAVALRNGYERAFPTIIDTHLCSIFIGIVLYALGNDQLKGFAISLTVGLIISLFTSLYMTRTMFDFWMARGWLGNLRMFRLLSKPNINFMGIRKTVFAIVVTVTLVGLGLFLMRMPRDLDIDFTGGTAWTAQIATGNAKTMTQLRNLLSKDEQKKHLQVLKVEELTQEGGGEDTSQYQYKIYYNNLDGSEPNPQDIPITTFVNSNQLGETQAERENNVAAAAGMPLRKKVKGEDGEWAWKDIPESQRQLREWDWSLMPLFPSSMKIDSAIKERYSDATRLFDIRTSEMEVELVERTLYRLLRIEQEDGTWKSILTQFNVEYDHKSLNWSTFRADGKRIEVQFSAPLIPDQFAKILKAELRREFGIGRTERLRFRFEMLGQDINSDGRATTFLIRFDPKLKDEAIPKVESALKRAKQIFERRPQPESLFNSDPTLAKDTRFRALGAIFVSWVAVVLYLWFRFGNWTFGAAAVLCLIHDLCFTLGLIGISAYVQDTFIGRALLIDDFKINLTGVAALLTLVGYSVADTIVVFDRIREVRGKNPDLTPKMINDSVNQTLSRTLLTSGTTFVVVSVLYWFGGPGIHLFAFIMVAGVFIGTFSSIYVASPLLLIFGEGRHLATKKPAEAAVTPKE